MDAGIFGGELRVDVTVRYDISAQSAGPLLPASTPTIVPESPGLENLVLAVPQCGEFGGRLTEAVRRIVANEGFEAIDATERESRRRSRDGHLGHSKAGIDEHFLSGGCDFHSVVEGNSVRLHADDHDERTKRLSLPSVGVGERDDKIPLDIEGVDMFPDSLPRRAFALHFLGLVERRASRSNG